MIFCDPTNFDLSPRFVSKLVEGGSGVGLLQRAQDDVTHRAHQLWLETGPRYGTVGNLKQEFVEPFKSVE